MVDPNTLGEDEWPRPASESRPAPRRKQGGPRRVTKGLVALSSAAILTVYAVGYVHTQPAEQRLAAIASAGVTNGVPPAPSVSSGSTAATGSSVTPSVADPAPAQVQQLPQSAPATAGSQAAPAAPATSGASMQAAPATSVPQSAPSTPAARVATAPPATPTPRPTVASGYRDGSYVGMGYSRHGNVEATVLVSGGKIASVQISQCLTRYPCSWISDLPGEVVQSQSTRINLVSGATDSSRAFVQAVGAALANARA